MQSQAPADDSPLNMVEAVRDPIERTVYRLQHRGIAISSGLAYRAWAFLLRPGAAALDAATIGELVRRFEALLERDLDNVRRGYYPRALLFQLPLFGYATALPEAMVEAARILWRRYRKRTDDIPVDAARNGDYPGYYLRNFHWQSDGWLSDRSARLYDPAVEFLFAGVADVMRRMAIPPVVDAARASERARILDVGCGTGRFLLQLARTLPSARLYGLDMSPFYVRHARKLLAKHDVTLSTEHAERMPWADAAFDVVTSVFVFHELPPKVRRTVAREMARVVAPGGRVVLCDSAQLCESAAIKDALFAFPDAYHEPFYRGYLQDDLGCLLEECGLLVETVEPHLVSKVVVARRPLTGQAGTWNR
jgi:ubiquinone/menaquinone biosynthesis C-methylase UbiE